MGIRIVCEGDDDKKFIISLMNHLKREKIINFDKNINQYFIIKNGKSKLLDISSYSDMEKQIKVGIISKLLFLLDCDYIEDDINCNGCENSEKCIKNLIKKLNVESKYFLFNKNLNFFILNSLSDDIKKCFEEFQNCHNIDDFNKNRKVLTSIYRDLYPKKPYDFSNSIFDELKNKLIWLFKGE